MCISETFEGLEVLCLLKTRGSSDLKEITWCSNSRRLPICQNNECIISFWNWSRTTLEGWNIYNHLWLSSWFLSFCGKSWSSGWVEILLSPWWRFLCGSSGREYFLNLEWWARWCGWWWWLENKENCLRTHFYFNTIYQEVDFLQIQDLCRILSNFQIWFRTAATCEMRNTKQTFSL